MKNKFDLFKPAIALAETLMGETNQKIHDAVSAAFDTTKAHDAEKPAVKPV